MTTPTNPSPMAKTEQEGTITFRTPSGHTATLVSVYDSPVENTDATAADLRAAGYVPATELVATTAEACRMHYLGNLIRHRSQEEQDELTRLMRKYPPRVAATNPAETMGIAGAWKALAHANGVAFRDAHDQLERTESELAAERARVVELEATARRAKMMAAWFLTDRWNESMVRRFPVIAQVARDLESFECSPQQPSPPAEPQQQGERVTRGLSLVLTGDATPDEIRDVLLGAMRESCETQLEGELPTSLYSPLAIAYAGSIGALRVTPSGLGFIKGLKPDLPAGQPSPRSSR